MSWRKARIWSKKRGADIVAIGACSIRGLGGPYHDTAFGVLLR